MKTLFKHGVATSRPENRLRKVLTTAFGETAVKQQVRLGRWSVDFYVEPIDVYVELDGVYWHGLNRPMAVIEQSLSRTDRKILGTFHKDRMQDAWFSDNGMRLVRITDSELKEMTDADIAERVRAGAAAVVVQGV